MCGLFKNIIYFTTIIFVHELGHFLMAKLLRWKVDKIYFYPYGGYSKFNDDLNKPKWEELLIMIMGPLVQILYFMIIKNYLTINELSIFKTYHYSILFFNLIPIYPLDGGKLLNILLNYFFSFRKSFKLAIIISYIIFALGCLYLWISHISISLSFVLVLTNLICKLTEELRKEKFYFHKFLLERYLNNYNFSKLKIIEKENQMKRDYKHLFFISGKYYSEREKLKNKFH